jgi:hypothetical protein
VRAVGDPDARIRLQASRVVEAFTKALCAEFGGALAGADDEEEGESQPASGLPAAPAPAAAAASAGGGGGVAAAAAAAGSGPEGSDIDLHGPRVCWGHWVGG